MVKEAMSKLSDLVYQNIIKVPGAYSRFIIQSLNDKRVEIFGKAISEQVCFAWVKDETFFIRAQSAPLANELKYQSDLILSRIENILGDKLLLNKKWKININVGSVATPSTLLNKKASDKFPKRLLPSREVMEKFLDPRIKSLFKKSESENNQS